MDTSSQARPGCGSYALLGLATLWMSAVIGLGAPIEWFAHEIVVAVLGLDWPPWASPAVALGQALLVLLAVGPLAALTKDRALRAIYRSWASAAGLLILFGLVRALPPGCSQAASLAYALLGTVLALLFSWMRRTPAPSGWPATGNPTPRVTRAGSNWPLGLAAALLLALPWLIFGALGSLLDTLLALLAAATLATMVVTLLQRTLLPHFVVADLAWPARLGLGGLGYGGTLLLIAAGAGFQSANLLLLATLPALGLAAMVLALPAPGQIQRLAPAALIGGAAAAPLALFDPDEITLLLGANEIPNQALAAAGWAFSLAVLLSVGAWLWASLRPSQPQPAPTLGQDHAIMPAASRPFAWIALGASLLTASLAYALLGQPGFYGDRLFVVLRDQADVSAASQISEREDRLRFVYTTLTDHAQSSQAELKPALAQVGGAPRSFYLVNGLEVEDSLVVRLVLLNRPEVNRVLASPRLRPLPAPPPPEPGTDQPPDGPGWNIRMLGAERVWDELGITGAGIVIGQSDSGVELAHPALQAGYRGSADNHVYHWFDPWFGTTAPRDYGMHGTHTLGSAAGQGGIGVAPGATWFACSNLARNLGNPAHYLDCMQFMLAPHPPDADPLTSGDPALAAHVLNNSWGCPPIEGCDPASLEPAVAALRAAGIFVVASAGNEGDRCASISSPLAIYADAFSVGAVDEAGNVASFSSRGPVEVDGSGRSKPDLLAPGDGVLSAAPGNSYAIASGTSMAGPHVAGVVALLWSANPALIGEIEATEQILRETARPYTGPNSLACAGSEAGNNVAGAGIVDAYAAVQAALVYRR
ncbi:MAG: S8 family serine peptidase [Oscillochloridaceae bacterium umkhey_bin13]